MKFLRRNEVCERTGLSYPTIWRRERAGAFPARRSLGPNSVGWLEHEVDKWIKSRTKRSAVAQQSVGAAA
jgi:prophage regulatory protein